MPSRARRSRGKWTKRVMGGLDGLPDDVLLPVPAALPARGPRVMETDVLRAALALCAIHPAVGWVRRMNVGGVKKVGPDGAERWVQFGFTGLSDIIGMMRDGRFLAVEVKRPGGRPTREQEEFLCVVAAWGGVACCVDSVEALKRVLDAAR